MKWISALLGATFILAVTCAAFAADEMKLGSVDFSKVAQLSASGKKASAAMSALTEKYQEEINSREKALAKLKDTLEGKGKKLTPAQLAAKEKEFKKKVKDYQEFTLKAQEEVRTKEDDYTRQMMTDMEKTIKEYGQANGYTAIVKKTDVVYVDAKTTIKDLSDDILKLLDAAATAPQTQAK